jgi:ATP-dependent DNA helicase RecG
MRTLSVDSPVTDIKNIGDFYASRLENLNIFTVRDLLFHIPSKYQDTSNILTIDRLFEVIDGTILCELKDIKTIYTRSRKVFTRAVAFDDTGKIEIIWFNQPYLQKTLKENTKYLLDGKLQQRKVKGRYIVLSTKF